MSIATIIVDLERNRDDLMDLAIMNPELSEEAKSKIWDSLTRIQETLVILEKDIIRTSFLPLFEEAKLCMFHRHQAD